MSNTVKVKRGAAKPTTSNLEEYELGYSTNQKKLYIRDKDGIVSINKNDILNGNLSTFNIKISDWKQNTGGEATQSEILPAEDYPYYFKIQCSNSDISYYPIVSFTHQNPWGLSNDITIKVTSEDGYLYFYANELPENNLHIWGCWLIKGNN